MLDRQASLSAIGIADRSRSAASSMTIPLNGTLIKFQGSQAGDGS